jgi:NAD(P)-dependent dehydrogenase (short-subunit alcohol dehydrogenase family)
MDLRLHGRHALITRSGTGIGAAMACRLATEGAAVLIHGRCPEAVDNSSTRSPASACPGLAQCNGALDWTLVPGRHQLLRVLHSYVRHNNHQQAHRGLTLAVPDPPDHDNPWQVSRSVQRLLVGRRAQGCMTAHCCGTPSMAE